MRRQVLFRTFLCLLLSILGLGLGIVAPARGQSDGDGDGDPIVIHGPDTVYNGFCPPDAESVPPYTYTATGGDGDYTFSIDNTDAASIDNINNTGVLHPLQSGTSGIQIHVSVTDASGHQDSKPVQIKPPEPPCENHFFLSVDESAGPRYRKVALNGLPMPDEKPQAQDETDQEKEETYVDAFSLSLRHSTTDIFVPLVGGELSLSVRRNLETEIWNDRYGQWAENRVDEPFGAGWSTGLTPHIQFVFQTVPAGDSNCPASRPPADYAYVTDESGTTHRFIMAYAPTGSGSNVSLQFFPLPTGRHEQDSFLASLAGTATDASGNYTAYTFKRKFGTTLTFQPAPALTTVLPADRHHTDNGASTTYFYARANSVTDRYQNSLRYTYNSGNNSLIPDRIASASSSGTLDGRSLVITHDALHISAILDPNGNQTTYSYTTQPAQSPNGTHTVTVLAQVTRAVGQPEQTASSYAYTLTAELDNTPQDATEAFNYYYQSNLASITDGKNQTYQFSYVADHSRYNFDSRVGYYVVTGNPMNVRTVQLPSVAAGTVQQAAAPSSSFVNHSLIYVTYTAATAGGPAVPSMQGRRETQITDAAGNGRTYDFTAPQFISLTEFEDDLYHNHDPRQDPLMISYGTMTLHVPGGQEVFNFDLSAGMALSSTTDFSGNTTTFTHTDSWSATAAYPWLHPSPPFPIAYYTDPTSQTTSIGTKHFHYDATWRVMDRVLDEENRLTVYAIDPGTGLRRSEDIYPANAVAVGDINGTPAVAAVQHTDFTYGNTNFRAFMTQKSIAKLPGDSSPGGALVTQYQPDSQGHLQSETVDPGTLALTTTYTYDNNGNKLSVKDPRQYVTGFKYDHLNRLYEVDYPASATHPGQAVRKTIAYDANSNKVKETDENGHATLFVYDALNRVSDTGRDMNGDGFLTRAGTNPDLVTSYAYNAVNSKLTVEDPRGYQTVMTYDALQRLATKRDAGGYTTYYYYTGPNPGGNCFDSSSFKPTSIIDPRGYLTTVTYDALYRETARSVPYAAGASSTTQTAYDKTGNPVQLTDPVGNVTLKTYDALNRLVQTTYASGTSDQASERMLYTSTGLVWQAIDGNNNVTAKQYDGAGRVTLITQPAVDDGTGTNTSKAPTSRTVYDANGNVQSVINARSFQTDYTYDERNRRTSTIEPTVTDPADGNSKRPVTTTAYDLAGNALSVTTALDANQSGAHTTTTLYDVANRPYQVTAPAVPVMPAGSTTVTNVSPVSTKTYDPNGNVLTATDANGNGTTNTYDALNRLTRTVDAANDPVVYDYDAVGNRVSVQEGNNPGTAFGYDSLNRNTFMQVGTTYTTAVAAQASHTTDFTYDALNKTGRRDQLNQVTTYGYDHRNRLQTTSYTNRAADNRTYTYDANGNLLTVSEPGKGGASNVAYTYDALNRTATEQSGGRVHQYFYDLAGNRTIAKYSVNATPAGRVLTSTYDPVNRLASLVEAGRTTGYTYDLEGSVVLKTLPDSEKVQSVYDALHRAATLQGFNGSNASLYRYAYNYDAVGNVRRSAETYASLPAQTITMGYDAANRLTQEDTAVAGGATTRVSYGYDTAHNRTSKAVAGGITTNYTFNGLNQLTGWSPSTGSGATYTYDSNGNRRTRTPTGGATTNYTYDFENRLVGVTPGTAATPVCSYVYDYRTRRVTRTENGASTQVVFSGGTSVGEYPASGAGTSTSAVPRVEYVRGSDWGGGVGGILYSLRPGGQAGVGDPTQSVIGAPARILTATYDHYNRRGDVVAETDGNAVVGYQTTYEAFGTRPSEYGSDPDRQRANTKEEDPTGLLNEGMRYRDLETGVFITRDPAGMVDGPNLYTYVNQNPWTKFDPEGLFWSAIVDVGFASWDTYQYARGSINGAEYSERMALTGASLLADAATGGMGGGVALRTAALAARAGKVGKIAVKTAIAASRANMAVSTAQAAASTIDAVESGEYGRAALSVAQVSLAVHGEISSSAKALRKDTSQSVEALVEGRLHVGSSNGFDKGQREMADGLNLNRVPSRAGQHAEENLIDAVPTLEAVGTFKRKPCGPSEHDCAGQLTGKGIDYSPFLESVAEKVRSAALSEPAKSRRTVAVGREAKTD